MIFFNKELIDTLWNVNETSRTPFTDKQVELIDTLWNVNVILWHFDKNTGK